jgi:hypothetical protein
MARLVETNPVRLFSTILTPDQLSPPPFPPAHYNNGGDPDPGRTLVLTDHGFHPLLDDLPEDLLHAADDAGRVSQRPLLKRILRLFRARVTDGVHFYPWHLFCDRIADCVDARNLLPINACRHSTHVPLAARSTMLVHRGCQALKEHVGNLHMASGRTQKVISWTVFFNKEDKQHWDDVMDGEAQQHLRQHFRHSKSQVAWEDTQRGMNLRIRYTFRADRCVLTRTLGHPLPHYYEAGDLNEWFIRPGFAEVPFSERGECSHLCLSGDQSCSLPAHLVFEPHWVNVQREACYRLAVCTRNGCGLLLANPDPMTGMCVGHAQPHLACIPPQAVPHDRRCTGHQGTWTFATPYKNSYRQLPPAAPRDCPVRRDPATPVVHTPSPDDDDDFL